MKPITPESTLRVTEKLNDTANNLVIDSLDGHLHLLTKAYGGNPFMVVNNYDGTTAGITLPGNYQGMFILPYAMGIAGVTSSGNSQILNLDFKGGNLPKGVTHTRTGPATFTNKNGYIETAEHNLIQWSENILVSPWGRNNGITYYQASVGNPFGGITANFLGISASSVLNSQSVSQSPSLNKGNYYTLRFWAKAGTSDRLSYGLYGSAFISGTSRIVSGPGSVSGSNIMSVTGLTSSTWTQLEYVVGSPQNVAQGANSIYLYPGNYAAQNHGDSVYVWGFQLNEGTTACPYYTTESTAYHAPRFEYSNGNCLGVLLEGSSTNLCTYSSIFDGAGWGTPVNATVSQVSQSVVAPPHLNSGITVYSITPTTTANVAHYANHTLITGLTTFQPYTVSVFVKPNGYTFAGLVADNNQARSSFDLAGMTSLSVSGIAKTSTKIESYADGWYRLQMAWGFTGNNTNFNFWIVPQNKIEDPVNTWTADGTKGIYVYGAQIENSFGASSYVPALDSTQITRGYDLVAATSTGITEWRNATNRSYSAKLKFLNIGARTVYPSVFRFYANANTVEESYFYNFDAYGISPNLYISGIYNGAGWGTNVITGITIGQTISYALGISGGITAGSGNGGVTYATNGGALTKLTGITGSFTPNSLSLGPASATSSYYASIIIDNIRYWPSTLSGTNIQTNST